MNAKQRLHVLCACQLRKENDLMAECMLLHMAAIDALVKMLALAILVGNIMHTAGHHFYQRKESQV